MTLWVCRKCGTKFAVGLRSCPACTGVDVYEDGDPIEEGIDMPKTTVHGGASNATADNTDDTEGGEQPSAGSSSSTSTTRPKKTVAKKTSRPKRARMTARPSSKEPAASSTAPSTGGSGPTSESPKAKDTPST